MVRIWTRSMVNAVIATLFILSAASPGFAQNGSALPKVRIVATGGTIAGEQKEPGTLASYEVKKPIAEVLSFVPHAKVYADIEAEQFSNVGSNNMTPDQWLKLGQRINTLFKERPDLSGIVVTHGTSTLEQTAFFLYLTVKSDRPVVLVGAQRPPTGISPDGPLNLLSAIRVAASPDARGKGAMVVMDNRILSARDVQKIYVRNGGFDVGEMGMLGVVALHGVEFFYQPARKHTTSADFDIADMKALPRVGISYSYAGGPGVADVDAKAVVVATTSFSPDETKYFESLRKKGIIVASTFPSGEEVPSPAPPSESALPPVIGVEHLIATKARILMMLALTKTQSPIEIQKIFEQY